MWRMVWGVLGVVVGVGAVLASQGYAYGGVSNRPYATAASVGTSGLGEVGRSMRVASAVDADVTANSAPNMKRWDYLLYEVSFVSSPSIFAETGTFEFLDGQRLSEDDMKRISLDSLGAAGWELVAASRNEYHPDVNSFRNTWTYVFKRQI